MAGISGADASQVRVDMAQIDSSQIVSADEFSDLVIPGDSCLRQVGDYAPYRLSLQLPLGATRSGQPPHHAFSRSMNAFKGFPHERRLFAAAGEGLSLSQEVLSSAIVVRVPNLLTHKICIK